MSMSVYYRGIKTPTDEFKKKLAAYRALKAADMEIPSELDSYFDGEEPDEEGMSVKIDDACEGNLEYEDGCVTIDLSKLPAGVTHIKVIASY